MSSMWELTFFLGLQTTSTPIETNKALVKDEEAEAVDVHLYRSMIGSLMYLTASRRNIMFAFCNCARFQVSPKTSHLYAVKRIFRYLKGQPKLGLWYPRDSPFELEAFTDSDYAGASLDRKFTTGGCQFLGRRLISWDSYEKRLIQVLKIHTDHNAADLLTKGFDVSRLKILFGPVLRVKHGKLSTVGLSLEEVLLGINFALTVSPTIYASYIEQFWNTACLKTINSNNQINANVDGKAVVVLESSVRRDLHLNDEDGTACLTTNDIFENLALMGYEPAYDKLTFYKVGGSPNKVGDEATNEEMLDSVERATTTASSLEAKQAGGNINKTQFTATLNEPFFLELGSGSSPWRQETIGDSMEHQIELTDNVPITPHDSPLPGVNTPGSDEGSLELNKLMDLVTKLSHRVLDLEKVKTTQAKEIVSLKRRVTKLEQRQRSRILKNHPFRFSSSRRQSLGEKDVSKQGRKHLQTQLQFEEDTFDDIDDLVDEGMAFVQEKDAENQGKIGVDDTEVVKGSGDTETLIKMKEEKTKEKGVVIKDVEDSSRLVRSITTLQPLPTIDFKDKGKGILLETGSVEKIKKKVQGDAQMERDAEVALRLQAELDEELRVERER
ncbi:hypothetical protein Tco_0896452 [Tanacetum coccineum]